MVASKNCSEKGRGWFVVPFARESRFSFPEKYIKRLWQGSVDRTIVAEELASPFAISSI